MPRQANAKKFVVIQSSQTIRVAPGLQYEDFTKKQSDVPDRMKVAPSWPNMLVLIKKGQHTYPAEVAEWPTVKNLEKDGVLTVGAFTDADNDGAGELQQVIDTAKARTASLSEIAGE